MNIDANVTIKSPIFKAHLCSGMNDEKISGSGCLNQLVGIKTLAYKKTTVEQNRE
jgi:hypothetical protein